jgi:hypothetical protein
VAPSPWSRPATAQSRDHLPSSASASTNQQHCYDRLRQPATLPLPDTTGHADPASDATDRGRHRVSCRARLLDAYRGSVGAEAVVTAFVLAAPRTSASTQSAVGPIPQRWTACAPVARSRSLVPPGATPAFPETHNTCCYRQAGAVAGAKLPWMVLTASLPSLRMSRARHVQDLRSDSPTGAL